MDKLKKVLIAIAFLIPSFIIAGLLTYFLAIIDYGPDPGTSIGTTLWGVWCLLCGFYFKMPRFQKAGYVLLFFAIVVLLV
ncbi:hypothetical protein D210916BOD24_17400 [Alteromonas sp. D210916BOD_24]|uniref:hypothetical protein n=1 Tax=Alteromonas sp. D210916BOD_24 TaxID=3157618 RepID=UPI00399C4E5F